MTVDKACPVVLREGETLEILAFEHPLAGLQLVKGSVEPGEPTEMAAARELFEEAGIQGMVVRALGTWHSPVTGHLWAFHECHVAQDLPETWVHQAEDDGGHEFRFFWHPLMSEPSEAWHQLFKDALGFIRLSLAKAPMER
ncbi:NUDIX hydrolase [Pseudomonas sp. NPDC089530]|uniref:NUDIX hydrolase n=1 Tax=Pseudomonas sp. NPDC089530 TaxID=3390651 RepID=UPI003D0874D6